MDVSRRSKMVGSRAALDGLPSLPNRAVRDSDAVGTTKQVAPKCTVTDIDQQRPGSFNGRERAYSSGSYTAVLSPTFDDLVFSFKGFSVNEYHSESEVAERRASWGALLVGSASATKASFIERVPFLSELLRTSDEAEVVLGDVNQAKLTPILQELDLSGTCANIGPDNSMSEENSSSDCEVYESSAEVAMEEEEHWEDKGASKSNDDLSNGFDDDLFDEVDNVPPGVAVVVEQYSDSMQDFSVPVPVDPPAAADCSRSNVDKPEQMSEQIFDMAQLAQDTCECKQNEKKNCCLKNKADTQPEALIFLDDENDDNCFICLSSMAEDDEADKIEMPCATKCNSALVHRKCIFEWKERRDQAKQESGTCPLCRGPLSAFTYSPPDLLQIHNFWMFSVRHSFVMHPVPQDVGMVRCFVRVTPGAKLGNSSFELFIQAPCALPYPLGVLPDSDSPKEGDQLLLRARKRSGLLSSRMEMTLDRDGNDFELGSPSYVGHVQSNFTGLEHTIATTAPDNSTRELGCIVYNQNRFGMGVGPRKLRIALPKVKALKASDDGEASYLQTTYMTDANRPTRKTDTLSASLQSSLRNELEQTNDFYYCENREPSWLEAIQAYSLDFHGRVTLPSNKNFQLCFLNEGQTREQIMLQFGKVVCHETNHQAIYTLDFQFPLSPVQAFGIALSSCDRKVMCA